MWCGNSVLKFIRKHPNIFCKIYSILYSTGNAQLFQFFCIFANVFLACFLSFLFWDRSCSSDCTWMTRKPRPTLNSLQSVLLPQLAGLELQMFATTPSSLHIFKTGIFMWNGISFPVWSIFLSEWSSLILTNHCSGFYSLTPYVAF